LTFDFGERVELLKELQRYNGEIGGRAYRLPLQMRGFAQALVGTARCAVLAGKSEM